MEAIRALVSVVIKPENATNSPVISYSSPNTLEPFHKGNIAVMLPLTLIYFSRLPYQPLLQLGDIF